MCRKIVQLPQPAGLRAWHPFEVGMQTSDKFIGTFEHSLVEFGKLQKHRAELPAQQSHPPCELVELGLAVGEIVIAEAVFVAARGIR